MKHLLSLFLLFYSTIPIVAQETNIKISSDLELIKISDKVYIHKSFTTSEQFGRYSSNGLIYINENEVLIADTPPSIEQSELLLTWIINQDLLIKAVIVNHHHEDALGGLKVFKQRNISTYGFRETSILAKKDGFLDPEITFIDSLNLSIGSKIIQAFYFGEAHTSDNIVLHIPSEHILFGGCMIKSLKSGKGNLADANVEEWPHTVSKVKNYFPNLQLVIPGHGNYGNTSLLDYTIKMFGE